MRSIGGFFLLVLLTLGQTQAQRTHFATLKGTVIDSVSQHPIEAATVAIYLKSDSTLITYAITNKKGEFLLKDIPQAKPCKVTISYSGLKSYSQEIIISPEIKELIITTVQLRKAYTELEEVIVSAQRPPVVIKRDTLEFNAGAFRTPVNGVVEDLLKQLPGVEVDAAGNITVNGKKVTKITVDGKDFFGSDFRITTKNLPKDMIDKVQVVDNKTREDRFNQTTTGNEEKAINLTLKKDRKRGLFGRASAGYGSEARYETGGSANYFNGPMQLSFIGYSNNTNASGLPNSDVSMGSTSSSFSGSGSGLNKTHAGGLNFSDQLGKKLRITGSYFYNQLANTNFSNTQRQNMLPDTMFYYRSNTTADNSNRSHRTNLSIETRPDSATELYVNGSFNISSTTSITSNDAKSTSIEGIQLNAATNDFRTNSKNNSLTLEAFYGRRLNLQGRRVTLNLSYGLNSRNTTDNNYGLTTFYKTNGDSTFDALDQQSHGDGRDQQFALSTTWTEPIAPKFEIGFTYRFNTSKSASNKSTRNYNILTGQYDLFDSAFSNDLKSRVLTHSPQLRFGYFTDRFNVGIGSAIQWLEQTNSSPVTTFNTQQRYSNVFPSANITYRYSRTGNINLVYNGRSQQPTMDQLQPVPDNTNTLYIKLGNPNLKPGFFHNIVVNFQGFSNKNYWNAALSYGTAKNQIVYETWLDSVQYSRAINSNGNWQANFHLNYSRQWKNKEWTLRLMLGTSGSINRNQSFSNKITNITKSYSYSQRAGFSYTYRELVTLMPAYIVRYTDTRYSIQQRQPTEIITQSLNIQSFLNWPKRIITESNLQFNYISRTAPGFPKGVTLWNIAVNWQLFKERQALLRLSIYDLLKQNNSIYRSITPTFVEDMHVQVLQRYVLLSFIYNVREFSPKK